jgi:hypothetical protein
VLMIETAIVHEDPVAVLDLLRSEPVCPVKPFFVPHPCCP